MGGWDSGSDMNGPDGDTDSDMNGPDGDSDSDMNGWVGILAVT